MATPQSTSVSPPVEYRDIPGHAGYRVGSDGTVWSRRLRSGRKGGIRLGTEWRRLKARVFHSYHQAHLSTGRSGRYHFIHRLVLLAFVGPCPKGMECCHGDGNPTNNILRNLRWDTPKANNADKRRRGTLARGSTIGNAKLTEGIVKGILASYAAGDFTQAELARIHRLDPSTICAIVNGKRWRHVHQQEGSK